MKVVVVLMLLLACVLLVGGTSGEEYSEEGVEIAKDEYEEYQIDLEVNDTLRIELHVTHKENDTSVDYYLLTSEELERYDRNESFNSSFPYMEKKINHTLVKKITEDMTVDGALTVYLVIDNWDNNRTTDALPNGTITVDIMWNITASEENDPNGDPTDPESGSTGDVRTFLMLAMVVIVVMAVIGLVSRRGGKSEGKEDEKTPEEEDFFGRIRIG